MNNIRKRRTSILSKLLGSTIPLTVLAIAIVIFISITSLSTAMTNSAYQSLQAETKANVNEISAWTQDIVSTLNAVQNTLEEVAFGSDAAELAYMKTTVGVNESFPSGIYVGDASGVYLDASGWVPDVGFVPSERDWYKEGLNHASVAFGDPYIDAESGQFIVSATALLDRLDRNKMVMAADVYLNDVSALVSQITIMDSTTGYSFLVDTSSETILAHKNTEYIAQKISTSDTNELMAGVASIMEHPDGQVHTLKDDGSEYYTLVMPVENTTWVLVSCISVDEVLEDVNSQVVLLATVAVVSIIILAVVIAFIIRTIVSPVKAVTEDIEKIAEGDFTVNVNSKSNDEIGVMGSALDGYIGVMRGIINTIHGISANLDEKAGAGRQTAQILNETATEQYESM